MRSWLDLELEQELRPVSAPDDLWRRVQSGRRAPARRSGWKMVSATAAAAVLIAAGLFWRGRPADFESLSARALHTPAASELRSSDAAAIGAWLRQQASVEVAIPAGSKVRLQGARVIRERGTRIGAVVFETDGERGLLLVARTGGPFRGPAKHGGLSWQTARQVYAIACPTPEQARAACALCHASL